MSERLPEDDTDLIRLAASCSEEAFCEVVHRFSRYITSVVSRYASRSVDREDLESEVIAKLLANSKRALRSWEPQASFGAYLATIASRHCMDWLRRRGGLPRARIPDGETSGPDNLLEEAICADDDADPGHFLESLERRHAIREAIDSLSHDDRLVLYLRFEQELSGVEISDLLGISHGAARQRLFRAARRLEDQIQEVCPELLQVERH
ncbi:MAG: sigma-70 family RNA polymerase sigma factor [Armatimonadia bacterium]|nr:sigma-70 family RNA polymerase sigma factor [Armatimonadia bacterium]